MFNGCRFLRLGSLYIMLAIALLAVGEAFGRPQPGSSLGGVSTEVVDRSIRYYLLFDVSATMSTADRGRQRYESIYFVKSLLREEDELRVYAFSDEVLPFTYENNGLLPPKGDPDFNDFRYPVPADPSASEREIKGFIDAGYKKHSGKDDIHLIARYSSTTPDTEVGHLIDELKREKETKDGLPISLKSSTTSTINT